jgi:RNA polymerase-binding transcription factor DksA
LLLEIIEAIRRIELGTYGTCQITGEPIALGRLNSIPWARYSLKGQQQMEQEGWGRKIGLPPLEGLATPEPREAESD